MDDSNFSVDYDVSPDEISDILNTSDVDASLDPVVVAPDEAASLEISAETESSPEQEASQEEESFLSVSGGDAAAAPFSEPVQVVLVESPELMEKLDQCYSMLYLIAAILLITFCRNCLSSWRNKTVKGGS